MELQKAVSNFLRYQMIKGNSSQTVIYYKNCLQPFVRFFGESYDITCFDKQELEGYAMMLYARPISSNSRKTYSKGVKAFLSWLYYQGQIERNLSDGYILPKAQRKIIDILTDDEIVKLLGSFDLTTHSGLRNYCICSLMLDSGLRKSEVIRLCPADLHLKEWYLIVNGKGDKQRIVPIGASTRQHLALYLSQRPKVGGGLFLTKQGTPITVCVLERMFKTFKDKLQMPRLRAHLLRHTFATRYLDNGGDIYNLQEILGHTTLEMTKVYLHLSRVRRVVNFSQFSPLDNLAP